MVDSVGGDLHPLLSSVHSKLQAFPPPQRIPAGPVPSALPAKSADGLGVKGRVETAGPVDDQ